MKDIRLEIPTTYRFVPFKDNLYDKGPKRSKRSEGKILLESRIIFKDIDVHSEKTLIRLIR